MMLQRRMEVVDWGKVILWVWSGGGQQWERQRPEGTRQ